MRHYEEPFYIIFSEMIFLEFGTPFRLELFGLSNSPEKLGGSGSWAMLRSGTRPAPAATFAQLRHFTFHSASHSSTHFFSLYKSTFLILISPTWRPWRPGVKALGFCGDSWWLTAPCTPRGVALYAVLRWRLRRRRCIFPTLQLRAHFASTQKQRSQVQLPLILKVRSIQGF